MESSESSKVMELERARALLAEQNAALELATVEAEIADVKANLAMESLRIGTAEFVNRFDFAPVGYGFQQSGPFGGMFSLSSSTDRVHGRDYPWLVSEADIRKSVGLARLVTKSHCPGVAIERNLKAHVIGKGGNYTAGVRKGAKVPDGLLEAIQDLVDEFVDENKILGEGEHEWYWRGVRDGETIVGLYPMPKGRHGIVDAREIEPLQVCTPGMAPLTDEEIVKRCGHDITCATNWEFGVHKADHDAQKIFGYAIEYDGDWDYLPARYVGHWKRNVDRNVCRGVTDFYQAWQWISEQSRLLGNTTAGAAERSAIAYIVQHIQGVTQAKVRSMRSDKADATYTYTGPSGATKQFHRENIPPGSKLDIPKGQEYVAIANGTDPSSAYISVLQAISRQVGIVWNMPEGMISGDDSGASVTASVVAGSRFDKFATMEQGAFGSFMLGILWKVIKFAYDRGRLERFGFSRDKDGSFYQLKKKIELIVKYPDVSNKHPIETEQLRQIRKQNGVLSVKTWTDEVGLDYETERKNMEEEQGGQGGGQPGMPGADGGMPPPDQGAGGPPGMPPGGPGGMPDQGGMPGMPPGGMPPMPPDQGGGGFGGPPPAPAPGPNPFQQATGYDPYIESPQPGEPVGGQTAYAQPSGGVTFRNAPGFGSQEQFARSLATVVESAVEKAVGKLAEELKSGGASESFFGHRGRPGAVGGSSPRAEPWQLTQAQYREQHPKVVAANKAIAEALENLSSVMRHSDNRGDWFSAGAKASAQLEKAKAEADAEHEQHVLSRLMKGQDVPPHVLADYPHANPKVVLSGGDALPDMLAKLGSLGVAEAHAPAGFNHTSPLVIDGDQYTGARCCVQGLDINIENRAGTQRSGVSDNGEPWCVTMRNDYGEIVAIDGQAAHDGRDFDPVDVFLGPCCDSELVFVVDQYRDDGAFDEHKCMVGWTNAADAARAYSSNYDDDRECGPITPMTMDEFKDWLRNPARLHSPASPNAHVVRDRVDDSPELSDDVLCLLDIADKFGLTDEEVDALSLLAEKKHVAEAHAPKGFNKTSPLIIDGKSYVGGQFVPGKSQSEVDAAAKVIRKDKDNSTQLDDRLTSMYNNRPTRQAAVVIRSLPDLIGRSASAFAGRDKINNDIDKVLSANGIVPGSDEHALAMDVVANKFTAMTDAEAEMEKRRTSVHPLVKDLMAELSEIGSHSASSLSDTHYFKTDDGLVIRYGDHAPIHSRSISDVEVVGHPYGEGWLHPSTVQVVTANKTAKQVGEEVKAALDEIRERKRRESSASTPAVREWASKKFANPEHAKAFVEWFGDSKVVDKNGEPLVVYHGTSADFDEFDTAGGNDLGSHFGSIRQSDDLNKTEGGRTIPVYLSIKNPLRLPDLERWNDESMLPNLKEHGIDVEIPKREYVSADMATNYMHNIKMKRKAIAAALDKAGYDGIVYSNTFEGGGEKLKGDAADSYIVFSPRQIKSATGNRGTFDPASNKITESIADQYGLTASERLAFEHATSWMPYHGPRGGHGWQSMQTGRVLYQIERPGDSQHEGPSADEPSSEAIRAQQAERERAARLERESREREIARRGQAKQSAMSQREMELQSERQRPEQAKRAAIAERERAEREHEEEKPKPVKPYPKGKVSPFTAEVIDDARHIPFVDEVQQIASDDYDGIEAAMTPAEKREMNESLDTKKQEYIDKRQEGEREYDDDKAREDYLDQFYQDNEDRFVKTGEMEWGIDSDGDRVLRFTTDDGSKYEISAQTVYPIPVLAGSLQISFSERDGGYKITGKAGVKTAMDVFRKVSASVVALVQNESPPALTFTAAEPSRQRLYDKMVQHVAAASPDYAAVAAKKLGGVKGYLVCRRDVLGKLRARYDSGSIASTLANGGELQTLVEQSIGEMAMHKPTKEFTLSPDMELDEINVDPESLTEEDLLDTLAEIESMERDENNNQEHTE